jgi:hypothetical protein
MFSKNILGLELDKNQKFSPFHFAMMGLNKERQGVFFDDDARISSSFNTIEERNSANIKVIKDRLSAFGIYGYLRFLGKKALVNFSDGSFAWGCEGNFYAEIPEREGFLSTLLENIYYRGGKFHELYLTIVQLLWFIVLILLLGFTIKFNKDYKMITLIFSIILIFSFVMVFEARARYLFNYSPFFMIGAGFGAYNIGIRLNSLLGVKN